jgi:hypothetical protein
VTHQKSNIKVPPLAQRRSKMFTGAIPDLYHSFSYHIGVFDKRSKELKLVPAVGIIPIQQKLKGLKESAQLDESILEVFKAYN